MTLVWIALALVVGGGRVLPLPQIPSLRREAVADPLETAQLLVVALSAGRPLGSALQTVRSHLDSASASAIDEVVGRSRLVGLARALAETQGPLADLAHRLARSQLTGAPALVTVQTYIASLHDSRRARAMEEARTLGVRLIVPVSLLLLPGFVALVIGPYVFEQLDSLLGTVPQ